MAPHNTDSSAAIDGVAEWLWNWHPIPVFAMHRWSDLDEKAPRIANRYRERAEELVALATPNGS